MASSYQDASADSESDCSRCTLYCWQQWLPDVLPGLDCIIVMEHDSIHEQLKLQTDMHVSGPSSERFF